MGFFVTDEEIKASKPPSAKTAKKVEVYGERGCDYCALKEEWPRLKTPRMKVSGVKAGDILVMGEGPGETEDNEGAGFVGEAGRFLRKYSRRAFLTERMAFTNAVRCRPPGNRTPTGRELHACDIYLEEDVQKGNFKAILGLGGVPLSKFVNESTITAISGLRFPVEIGGKALWYFPTFHPSFILRNGGEQSSQFPVFRADLETFFAKVDRWKPPVIERPRPEDVHCCYSEDAARGWCDKLKADRIGFDIETLGLHPYNRSSALLTAAVSDGVITVAWPIEHPQAPNRWGLKLALELTARREWVAHNLIFELVWLLWMSRRENIPWDPAPYHDSMALGRLYYQRDGCLGLDIMSRLQLGINVKKLTNVAASRIMHYMLSEILPYNGLDAWASAKLDQQLSGPVNRAHGPYYDRLIETIASTATMEIMGLPFDRGANAALKTEWSDKVRASQVAASNTYEVRQFEKEHQISFKLGSADHVSRALTRYGRVELPMTAKGNLSVDDGVLLPLAGGSPLVRARLDFMNAQKQEGTYVDALARFAHDATDGLLHPTYSALRVATFRLSSSDFNVQNVPKRRNRELRRQVIAPPGHVICAFDSGQIQARIYAMASRDAALRENFINAEDIHTYWLQRLIDTYYPDYLKRVAEMSGAEGTAAIRKAARDYIKTDFTFAIFFGSMASTASDRTGIPLRNMEHMLEEFWGRYPAAQRWLNQQRSMYRKTGGVYMMDGSTFRHGVMTGNEMVITPIQNGESVLMLEAQNELSQLSKETGDPYLHPRINIHDDLTFIFPEQEDRLEVYIQTVAQAMVKLRHPWQNVPLTVEVQLGENWCDLAEITTFTGEYHRI